MAPGGSQSWGRGTRGAATACGDGPGDLVGGLSEEQQREHDHDEDERDDGDGAGVHVGSLPTGRPGVAGSPTTLAAPGGGILTLSGHRTGTDRMST